VEVWQDKKERTVVMKIISKNKGERNWGGRKVDISAYVGFGRGESSSCVDIDQLCENLQSLGTAP
jgi:hypothetical protein